MASKKTEVILRVLTLCSSIGIFCLIILGGIVRVTDSGLGCPDWPLCHGRIIPTFDKATIIEYSHRLFATFAGLMVFGTALLVWKAYRSDRVLIGLMSLSVLLLIVQVLLGWATVDTELEKGLVMAHLAVAEALLACIIWSTALAWKGYFLSESIGVSARFPKIMTIAIPVILLSVYAVILAGSYVHASGSTVACGDSWPLCQGDLLPRGELAIVHMIHRFMAIPVAVILLIFAFQTWNIGKNQIWLQKTAICLVVLFLVQIMIGGLNVWLDFHPAINVLHLGLASGIWVSTVLLAALYFMLNVRKTETFER